MDHDLQYRVFENIALGSRLKLSTYYPKQCLQRRSIRVIDPNLGSSSLCGELVLFESQQKLFVATDSNTTTRSDSITEFSGKASGATFISPLQCLFVNLLVV